jgi:hypothetical protein
MKCNHEDSIPHLRDAMMCTVDQRIASIISKSTVWVPMPEASVDKHSNLVSWENNVRCPWQVAAMKSEPVAHAVK